MLSKIRNAGAVFLGPFSPVALGDYVAGPSHVLPTGATARFASGLSSNDFLRSHSVIQFTQEGLDAVAEDALRMAEREGLSGAWSECGDAASNRKSARSVTNAFRSLNSLDDSDHNAVRSTKYC